MRYVRAAMLLQDEFAAFVVRALGLDALELVGVTFSGVGAGVHFGAGDGPVGGVVDDHAGPSVFQKGLHDRRAVHVGQAATRGLSRPFFSMACISTSDGLVSLMLSASKTGAIV